MNEHNDIFTAIIAILAVVIVGGEAMYVAHRDNTAHAYVQWSVKRMKRSDEADYHKHVAVKHDLMSNAESSSDPVIKALGFNHNDNKIIMRPCNKFFSIMYTYSDHDSYVARSKKLEPIATKAVYGNKHVFDNDKDTSGESIVNNEQLHSSFQEVDPYVVSHKGDNLSILADAKYNAWTTGNSNNQQIGENWFKLTYNTKSGKFTSMNKVGIRQNISQ